MAGPNTVQRIPRGLLELLNMKGAGQLPSELAGALVPTIDVRDLYAADLFQAFTCNTNVANLTGLWGSATVGSQTVPAGELWVGRRLTVTSTDMAVGEAYNVRLAITRANFAMTELSDVVATASGAGTRIGLGWDLNGMLLRPQDSWGIFVTQITAGAHAFTIGLSYDRLTF